MIQKNSSNFSLISLFLVACLYVNTTNAQVKSIKFSNKKEVSINESKTITGVITNQSTPLPGVNVFLKGTNIGTVTDVDGNFELTGKFKKGEVIVFSSLGHKTIEHILTENITETISFDLKETSVDLEPLVILGASNQKAIYSSKKNIWKKLGDLF